MVRIKHIRKNILGITLFVVFLYVLSSIDKKVLENISISLGWFGSIFLIVIFIATHVFAPISGTALYITGIRIYSYEKVLLLFYIASMISASICFFIARKWGRSLVIKLVGENAMNTIDKNITANENHLLIFGRIFGYSFFEFISYALGLTQISFKKYITYTAIFTCINSLILYFVFRNFDFESFQNSIIYYAFIVITGLLLAYLFSKVLKKNNKE